MSSPLGLESEVSFSSAEEAIVSQQFVLFTHRFGPIVNYKQLLELLSQRLGDQTTTEQELTQCYAVWKPDGKTPLSLAKFRELIGDVRKLRLEGKQVFLTRDECVDLFYSLSMGGEFVSSRIIVDICSALECSPPSAAVACDYVSLDGFIGSVASDGILSRKLALHLSLLLEAATCEDAEEALTAADPEVTGGFALTVTQFIAIISTARASVEAEIAQRREMQIDSERAKAANKKRKPYFYPESVVESEHFSRKECEPENSPVPPVRIQGCSIREAIDSYERATTAPEIVTRVTSLKQKSTAVASLHLREEEELIRHAVYDASRLRMHPEDSGEQYLRDMSFLLGVGEKASKRLFPHHLPPRDNLKTWLHKHLEVEYATPKKEEPSHPLKKKLIEKKVTRIQRSLPQQRHEDEHMFFSPTFIPLSHVSANYSSVMPTYVAPPRATPRFPPKVIKKKHTSFAPLSVEEQARQLSELHRVTASLCL